LKEYDRVVCAPGGMCMGGFANWDHIWQLDVARRLNKPVFYWAGRLDHLLKIVSRKNSLKNAVSGC